MYVWDESIYSMHILSSASDDMSNEERNLIQTLVEDIWTTRATKIRTGLIDVINEAESVKSVLVCRYKKQMLQTICAVDSLLSVLMFFTTRAYNKYEIHFFMIFQ
jgi:transglutaminase/protease-like cytokinesis protein 3